MVGDRAAAQRYLAAIVRLEQIEVGHAVDHGHGPSWTSLIGTPCKHHCDLLGAAFGAHVYGDDEDVPDEPETMDDALMPDILSRHLRRGAGGGSIDFAINCKRGEVHKSGVAINCNIMM